MDVVIEWIGDVVSDFNVPIDVYMGWGCCNQPTWMCLLRVGVF